MKSIEERIVSMQFDNKQFEKGAKQSIDTLDKLNKSLEFKGASKNLKKLQEESKQFSLESIAKNVDDLSNRFSNFGIIGMTVLQDITRSAISSGKKIMDALTIEAPKMGFAEYETQINAIQTILANTQNKGTTLDEINDALDTLNEYADLTIYNFTQMTENIGRFTATGLDLDLSTTAIKGMSNLAAMAGSTAAQLNSAMYQLSQGLSAGVIKLQDWNSLRNANITNQSFRDSLIETARVHGVQIDKMIEKYGNLEYSLQQGWLTSEIMMETLLKFSNEFSASEWVSIGYTEEQAAAIIKLGETAMGAATDVKTLTQLLDTTKEALQSGWTQSWEIIVGDFEEAKVLFTEISGILGSAIEKSATSRNIILESWKALGGRNAIIDSLRNSFNALISIVSPIKEAFSEIFPSVTGRQLAQLSKEIESFTEKLILSEDQANTLKNIFRGLFSILKTGIDIIIDIGTSLTPIGEIFIKMSGDILNFLGYLGKFIFDLTNTKNEIYSFSDAINFVAEILNNVYDKINNFLNSIKTSFDSSGLKGIFDFIKNAIAQVGAIVSPTLDKLTDSFRSLSLTDIVGSGVLIGGLKTLHSIITKIKSPVLEFKNISETISEAFGSVTGIFEEWQNKLKSVTLLQIAAAIGIISVSLIALSYVNADNIGESLGAVAIALTELIAVYAALSKFKGAKGGLSSASILVLAAAFSVLSGAIVKISEINVDKDVLASLGIVSAAMAEMVAVSAIVSKIGNAGTMLGAAVSIAALSVSFMILASSINKFNSLDLNSIGKSLLTIGVLFSEMAIFSKFSSNTGMISIGIFILEFSAALLILNTAMKNFAAMNLTEIVTSLGAIAGIMAVFIGTMKLLQGVGSAGVSASLLLFASSLLILTAPLAIIGSMPIDNIIQGILGIGSAMVVIAGSIALMTSLSGGALNILAVSSSLLVMAAALTAIAVPITLLGSLPWPVLLTGFVALIGILTTLGVATALLSPLSPIMLAVAASFGVFGVAILAVGGGISLLATGLALLATSAYAGASALLVAIPVIGEALASLVRTALEVIQGIAPMIMDTIGILILSALETLLEYGPSIAAAGWELFKQILHGIVLVISEIWPAIKELGTAIITAVGNFFAPMVEAGKNLVQGLIDGLLGMPGAVFNAAKEFGSSILSSVKDVLGIHSPSTEMEELGVYSVAGYINGINSSSGNVTKAGEQIGANIQEGTTSSLASILASAKELGSGTGSSFSEGVASGIKKEKSPEEAAAEKANEIKEAFSEELDAISLDIKTSQLELELWKTQNELVLDEEEYYAKQKEQLNEEIALQTEKTNKANEKYLKMVETFGESSEYAQEAYNEWLEEQKNLAELSNKLAAMVEENADNIVEAYDAMNSALDRQMSKNDINEQIGDQFRPELESLKDTKEEVDRLKEELDAGWEEYNKIKKEYADDPEAMQERLDAITPDLYEKQEEYYAALEKLEDLEPKVAVKYFTETARSMRKYYLQAEKVNTSLDKYNALLADNESSQEDIEQAYNDYLQARKDLLDISSEYADTIELDENGKIILNSFANALGENWYLVSDELGELMDDLSPIIEESNLPDSFKRMLQKFFDDPSLGTLLSAALSELLKFVFTNIDFGAILKSLFNGDAVAGIATAVSTIFGGLGEVFGGIGAFVIQAIDMIGPAITALFASTGPVGIAIAVIAALGVAFVVAWNKSEKFRDFVTKAFNKIKEVALAVFEALKTAWTTVMNIMLAPVKLIISAIEAVINGVKKMIAFLRGEELETDVNVNTGSSGDNAKKEGASLGNKLVSGISGALSGAAVGGILLGPIGAIGGAIIGGFKSVFDIHSPSRVTAEIGKMLVFGLNKGIEDNTYTTRYATDNYGKEVMKSLANTFDNIDNISEPTIRPVMDLSNVRKGATEMDSLISRKATFDISGNVSVARKASASLENQNGDKSGSSSKASSGTSYNFTQNNYSPKALSKSEIYRQTRNQFSTLKGLVEN